MRNYFVGNLQPLVWSEMQERTKTSDILTDSVTKCHHVDMISSYYFPTFTSVFSIKLYGIGDQNDKLFLL